VMKPGPSTAKMRMSRVLQVRQGLITDPCVMDKFGGKYVLVGRTYPLTLIRLTHLDPLR
jgi:hypothetical protein